MSSQSPPVTATLEWHDGLVRARLPGRAGAALDLDDAWFDDVVTDEDGGLSLQFPFAPNGDEPLDLIMRDRRDGDVLARHAGGSRGRLRPPRGGEWLLPFDAQPMQREVAIVVPIYNAAESVARCLASVLAHTSGPARLILIDDASTDSAIAPLLERHVGQAGIDILRNARNLGFTATVNRGIAHAGRADVVLLNADTQVGPNWLTGLRRAAHAREDIATATAVSDNAGAFSVPELERENGWPSNWRFVDTARAHWQHAGLAYPQLPTGNGFCMYIRRDVFDAVGLFDEQAFAQGYGEENDFCQRACANGRRHVIAGNVFVHHERSMSFGVERRISLGISGMQVLRERWPNYEADVGATLFSFERRVLDWRVRRIHALAPGSNPRPRVLRIGAPAELAGTDFEVWQTRDEDRHCVLHDGFNAPVETVLFDGNEAAQLACVLQSHAFELLDLQAADGGMLAGLWAMQARRLGIAVLEQNESSGDDVMRYHTAIGSQASFREIRA